MIDLRRMIPEDIPAGVVLCRAAGWNQLERDWRIYLEQGDCRVAMHEGKIVGTAGTFRYGSRFSWIGLVLVDPACRRQGIGRRLLQEVLQLLSGEETVKLDATPAGREVYSKLDFVDEYALSRMVAGAPVVPRRAMQRAAGGAGAVEAREMPGMMEGLVPDLDKEAFGADRGVLLEGIRAAAPQYAFYIDEGNGALGYCLGRAGYLFTQIGPVVASNGGIAQRLVAAALRHAADGPVVLDVPLDKPDWIAWLREAGFAEQRRFTRMYRGANAFPGNPRYQFAITGPEFG